MRICYVFPVLFFLTGFYLVQVIPMNADKPSGIDTSDFLPKQFSGLSMGSGGSGDDSRFSGYKGYNNQAISEQEVTSNILKGHQSMMTVLTTRGRNIEIIHKLWQNKDAKAGEFLTKEYEFGRHFCLYFAFL